MDKKTQNVRFEFFQYRNDTLNNQTITLPYNNFASIKFVCGGSGGLNGIRINNIYQLDSLRNYITGLAKYPYELILNTNLYEIDNTNYKIELAPQSEVNVIVKWYSK